MSVFTNQKSAAKVHAFRYTEAVIELLGERDPIEVMSAQVPWLKKAVKGLDAKTLRTRESPRKWSILEVLGHLSDTELVYRYRLRLIVAEPGCAIVGYDQDAWAKRLRYQEQEAGHLLKEIDVMRAATLRWISTLTELELDRAGQHDERGEETVRHLIRMVAGHDLLHRAQIERIRATVTGR
ncbi:MAG TPA: DinB family protein [Longimicrobiales bacterium]|nr:DinB family protein [Longimicrobiales bacterium]